MTSLESSSLALLLNSALKESRCMTVQSKSGMIQKQLRMEKTFSSLHYGHPRLHSSAPSGIYTGPVLSPLQ